MTRFMMTLEDAVELVLFAFHNGNNGDIFVQKAPAATIETLVAALKQMLDRPDHEVRSIGTRHGEKLFESLLSREERAVADDIGAYFRVPPAGRDLTYDKFFDQGEARMHHGEEYNSHNTPRPHVDTLKNPLRNLRQFTSPKK